jgi:hypothetical protein
MFISFEPEVRQRFLFLCSCQQQKVIKRYSIISSAQARSIAASVLCPYCFGEVRVATLALLTFTAFSES